jgi:GMP synthase (glutamine-hydrolysing)
VLFLKNTLPVGVPKIQTLTAVFSRADKYILINIFLQIRTFIMDTHILVLNLLAENDFKSSFQTRTGNIFNSLDINTKTYYFNNLDKIDSIKNYTHLLISGSTASATDERDWYPNLHKVIASFISAKKSILGICFGHQFLIRHIMGKEHVRKSATPEIGWTRIKHTENSIFKGMNDFKSGVYHYDEVYDLDDRFEIIASSDRCAVQGFQLKNHPIWGVQFHPDFLYEDMEKFSLQAKEKGHDSNDAKFCGDKPLLKNFSKNDLLFANWINFSESF